MTNPDADTVYQIGNSVGAITEPTLKAGDIVGGAYKIKHLIGKGGMGYVFCAEHQIIGRDYALKILASDQLNEDSLRRFAVEGRAIANLDHVNIVKVYNMGLDQSGCPYYVMDLLDGASLADCIQSGMAISFADCLEIFSQTAAGLAYAHAKGIVHRDVKPSNVVLLAQDNGSLQVKIVDFGIAKILLESSQNNSAAQNKQSQTATGEVFGSPFYMSPEQCLGEKIDVRSDVYSLGCTLYETLAGRPPYVGENALATVFMHHSAPIPSLLAEFSERQWPPSIDVLLSKMLAKNPSDRYQTMQHVMHDIERIKINKPIGRRQNAEFQSSDAFISTFDGVDQVDSASNDQSAPLPAESSSPQSKPVLRGVMPLAIIAVLLTAVPIGYFVMSKQKVKAPLVVASRSTSTVVNSSPRTPISESAKYDNTGLPPLPEGDPGAVAKTAVHTDEVRRIFLASAPIVSKIIPVDGRMVRQMNFPKISFGRIDCGAVQNVPAIENVVIPRGLPVSLSVKSSESDALDNPESFERIGWDEISVLRLTGQHSVEMFKTLEDARRGHELQSKYLGQILHTISHWHYLHSLSLNAFILTPEACNELDKMHLDRLELHDCECLPTDIADRAFWQHLRQLQLEEIGFANEMLSALKNSPNLHILKLDNVSNINPASLEALASCKHFNNIELYRVPITAALCQALAKIPSLRLVRISASTADLDVALHLALAPQIEEVRLAGHRYSETDRRKYSALSSKLVFEQ